MINLHSDKKTLMKESTNKFIFSSLNYKIMGIGVLTLLIGFFLMSGGKAESPEIFNEEVFSTTRITIAPIMILLGYAIIGVGIVKKSE